jgi:DNA polymerase III epsilon subunit-like protein
MSNIQYELICGLSNKLNTKLILVGDPNQNIHQFQNGSEKYLMEYGGNEYFLTENNRATSEITNFINYFRPWSTKYSIIKSTALHTQKKPIVFTGTHDDICSRILNELKHTKIPLENIAIIGPIKKSSRLGLQKITNFLNKHGIKFIKHYNESTYDQEYLNDDIPIEKGKVNIYTIYGSKGTEFDKVILINFHFRTFEKNLSQEDYNHYKYLWYVALSRAKYELLVCADCDTSCWNELQSCPENTYIVEGDEVVVKPQSFTSNYSDTDQTDFIKLLNDEKYFDNKNLSTLHEAVNITETKSKLFNISHKNNFTYNQKLIMNFLKCVFEYHYCLFNLRKFGFVERMENFIDNIIFVNNKYKLTLHSILSKINIGMTDTLTLSNLELYKNKFTSIEKKVFEIIKRDINYDFNKIFSLAIKNDYIFIDVSIINEICKKIKEGDDVLWNIFKLCLFEYQYCNEEKYLWDNIDKFKNYITDLEPYINKIIMLSALQPTGYIFSKKVIHPNILINGTIDIISNNGTIILIEFDNVKLTLLKTQLIGFLHYHCLYNKWNNKKMIEIWNFKTGLKHILNFQPLFRNIDISLFIAEICRRKLKNMIFVYDLETTGLDVNRCEIIERYFHELCHDETFSEGVIKPKHNVPQLIIDITGISKKEIRDGEDIKIFSARMKKLLNNCKSPLFIAHNGNVFDHQIMRKNNLLNNDCKFLDSRIIIRQLSHNRVKNETLLEIYNIIMEKQFNGKVHRAKADVIMLLDIFTKLNINEQMLLKLF